MTSLQAGHLRARAPNRPNADLAAELFTRATARTTFPVWMMTRDRRPHACTTPPDRPTAVVPSWCGVLFDQFLGAAETEPVLAKWFLRRFSLLDSLYMSPSARLVGRTIRHNMRCWLAERRELRGVRRHATSDIPDDYAVSARSRSGSR